MAFSVFQNNGVEITGGNCIFSYDPSSSGSYNTAGLPGTSNTPQGVSINFVSASTQYLTYNPTYLSGTTSSVTFGTSDFTFEASIFITQLPGTVNALFDCRGPSGLGAGFWCGFNANGTIQLVGDNQHSGLLQRLLLLTNGQRLPLFVLVALLHFILME